MSILTFLIRILIAISIHQGGYRSSSPIWTGLSATALLAFGIILMIVTFAADFSWLPFVLGLLYLGLGIHLAKFKWFD